MVVLEHNTRLSKDMSQWLLKKKNKRRSKSTPPSKEDIHPIQATCSSKFTDNILTRETSPFSLYKRNPNPKHIKKNDIQGPSIINILGTSKMTQNLVDLKCHKTNKEESVYNEPWDVHCQILAEGKTCSACMRNTTSTNLNDTRTNTSKEAKGKRERQKSVQSNCQGKKDESDTGCEISDSGDDSDYYEFLENIERRLKIDHSKSNPVIMPKWDSPYSRTDTKSLSHRPGIPATGFITTPADEFIYKCASDNSSGFHEPLINKQSTSGMEFSELFSFPSDPDMQGFKLRKYKRSFTGQHIYQTGHDFKGNRLLGDLIQLNYEKQQLH